MKKFSTQPSQKRWYDVIRWNELTNKWEPIENFPTQTLAKQRAEELERDYNEELRK